MYLGKIACNWESGCIRAKLDVFERIRLHCVKLVVFEQNGSPWANWLYLSKKVHDWLYFGKVVAFGQNWLYWGKMVLFGQNICIWEDWSYFSKMVVFG